MSTFFPPSSPTSLQSRSSMGPPSLPSHAHSSSSSSPFNKNATSTASLPSSSLSFKDRLMFKKKTPLMASNHSTKIKSGYATPSTSSPAKTLAVGSGRKEGRENREGGGGRAKNHHLLSPPTSSSSSTALFVSSSPPRTHKPSTTKTLLANPRANLSSLLASSSVPPPPSLLTLTLPSLVLSTPLILGRRLKHPTRLSSSTAFIQTNLQTTNQATTTLKHLPLPRHALHASRLHCIVQPLSHGIVRVVVLGQNGMKVMGKRVKMGETVVVDVGKGGEVRAEPTEGGRAGFVLRPGRMEKGSVNANGLRLDFWGVKVVMPWGEVVAPVQKEEAGDKMASRDERSSSPLTEEDDEDVEMKGAAAEDSEEEEDGSDAEDGTRGGQRRPQPFSSLPPSSPPPLDFLSSHDTQRSSFSPEPLSLSLFPSSPPSTHHHTTNTHPSTPPNKTYNDDVPNSSPASSHHSYVFSPPPSPSSHTDDAPTHTLTEPLGPIPGGTDLPSLLSSTLVFSHQTSMSLPDLVRAVLEAQPGLRELGREEEWRGWCAGVLEQVEGMFGRIERKGKDASGQPLLDLFFYDPARDPDQIRAKELGGLMRPLRGTQRQGKTYFFKRPSTPGRKRK
ncbi:hypothetical protein BDY24DRAFT_416730 [Mrakia frigida]|uniref:uncharacterized protein n=1 Tax=Mrakia frigida TaxID=29902 RepID=UPI003FCC1872